MSRLALVAVLVALAPVVRVRAQECTEGRVRTNTYCCWPDQTFSSITRTCVGTPRCPEGLTVRGAVCALATPTQLAVPRGYAAEPPAIETPPDAGPAGSVAAWPSTHAGDVLHRPGLVRGRDQSLISLALSLFDTGWALGWLAAYADENARACGGRSCNSWPLAFLPLVGGIASTTVQVDAVPRNNGAGLTLGILSVLLESIGIVAIGIAIQNRTRELGFPRLSTPSVVMSLVPSAPGALAGLSLEGTY